jgi:hypothetical protein
VKKRETAEKREQKVEGVMPGNGTRSTWKGVFMDGKQDATGIVIFETGWDGLSH